MPCANGWQIKIVFGGPAGTQRPCSHFLRGATEGERRGRVAQALKLLPHPQLLVALGLLKTKPRPMISSLKSISVPLR